MQSYRHKWRWPLKLSKFGSCIGKHQKTPQTRKLKLGEIAEELKVSEGSEFTIFHDHLSMRKLCSKWVLCLLTVNQKQQSVVCNCFNTTKRSFWENMWQWMKHRSTTSLWSRFSSQLSGQQQVKAIQRDQRCKPQQASFWPPYLGMRKVFCSLIILRKEESSIVNII